GRAGRALVRLPDPVPRLHRPRLPLRFRLRGGAAPGSPLPEGEPAASPAPALRPRRGLLPPPALRLALEDPRRGAPRGEGPPARGARGLLGGLARLRADPAGRPAPAAGARGSGLPPGRTLRRRPWPAGARDAPRLRPAPADPLRGDRRPRSPRGLARAARLP